MNSNLIAAIQEYAEAYRCIGVLIERADYDEAAKWREKYLVAKAQIEAILGGKL